VRPGLINCLGIVGPRGGQRCISGLLEEGGPTFPAARQQPEAVDEDGRRAPRGIRLLDLLGLALSDLRHADDLHRFSKSVTTGALPTRGTARARAYSRPFGSK